MTTEKEYEFVTTTEVYSCQSMADLGELLARAMNERDAAVKVAIEYQRAELVRSGLVPDDDFVAERVKNRIVRLLETPVEPRRKEVEE